MLNTCCHNSHVIQFIVLVRWTGFRHLSSYMLQVCEIRFSIFERSYFWKMSSITQISSNGIESFTFLDVTVTRRNCKIFDALRVWYHLNNLKNVKNTHGGELLLLKLQVEVCNFSEALFLLGCYSRFLNCTNGTHRPKRLIYMLFFVFNTFTSNTSISNIRLKLGKNQAKAKQHAGAKLLLFENYSLSNMRYSKKYAKKQVCLF